MSHWEPMTALTPLVPDEPPVRPGPAGPGHAGTVPANTRPGCLVPRRARPPRRARGGLPRRPCAAPRRPVGTADPRRVHPRSRRATRPPGPDGCPPQVTDAFCPARRGRALGPSGRDGQPRAGRPGTSSSPPRRPRGSRWGTCCPRSPGSWRAAPRSTSRRPGPWPPTSSGWSASSPLPGVRPAVVDGDTPMAARDWARSHANYLLTTPDMLHQTLLPRHARWNGFFRRLRYIIVDECHTYRGVFGSHVAQVLRRLHRIAAHHGDPVGRPRTSRPGPRPGPSSCSPPPPSASPPAARSCSPGSGPRR